MKLSRISGNCCALKLLFQLPCRFPVKVTRRFLQAVQHCQGPFFFSGLQMSKGHEPLIRKLKVFRLAFMFSFFEVLNSFFCLLFSHVRVGQVKVGQG